MSTPNADSGKHTQLRLDAEGRLDSGTAPSTIGWPAGVDALGLLHRLASAPTSAGDALKLLHELQVHQVELDLQHEQIEADQRELSADRARYKALFELAPIGYFRVGRDGHVIDVNPAGAALFAVAPEELTGRPIDGFLAPESRPVLRGVLQRLRGGDARAGCTVNAHAGAGRRLQAIASRGPDGVSFLLAFVETPQTGTPGD